MSALDKEMKVTRHLRIHTRASTEKDQKRIVQQLAEANVFAYVSNRKHSQIKTDYSSLFSPFKRDASMKWTKEHLTDLRSKMTTEKRSQ